jgi:hypothetical protein
MSLCDRLLCRLQPSRVTRALPARRGGRRGHRHSQQLHLHQAVQGLERERGGRHEGFRLKTESPVLTGNDRRLDEERIALTGAQGVQGLSQTR